MSVCMYCMHCTVVCAVCLQCVCMYTCRHLHQYRTWPTEHHSTIKLINLIKHKHARLYTILGLTVAKYKRNKVVTCTLLTLEKSCNMG